jgi:hypothetical protein
MVVDVLVRPLRWVARAATGLAAFAAAVILGAGLAAPAPAAASTAPPASTASAPAPASVDSASVDAATADERVAAAPAVGAPVDVDVPVTRPGDRVAADRWQRPAPGQRGPPSGE